MAGGPRGGGGNNALIYPDKKSNFASHFSPRDRARPDQHKIVVISKMLFWWLRGFASRCLIS